MNGKEKGHRAQRGVHRLAVVAEGLSMEQLRSCRTGGVYICVGAEARVKSRAKASRACRKRRFRDIEQAKSALGRARVSRRRAEDDGLIARRRECRYYWCVPCAAYHLTSKQERIVVKYAASA